MSVPGAPTAAHDRRMQPDAQHPAPLRVVVVDPDDRVRESLARLLCVTRRIETVATAGRSSEALDVVRATEPDVVLLEPRLPDIDAGIELIASLRVAMPGCRIVVLGSAETFGGVEFGTIADAVVRKTFRTDELVAAVLAAAGATD
jgi:DNA-binding NarL/FixJ family response regulator